MAAARSAAVSTLVHHGADRPVPVHRRLAGAAAARASRFFTESQWLPETGTFGIASLLWGTILVGLFALVVAVPLGFGAALFISEYAPRSLQAAAGHAWST